MKTVLIVVSQSSAHLVCELPRLFKKGGFRVTVLAFPHWSLTYCSYIDERINAPVDPQQLLEKAALLMANRTFDLKILSSDALIWALADSKIDPVIKAELSPIKNPSYLYALHGKVGAAQMFKELEIPSPPSKVAYSLAEAAEIASEIGLPVILKVSRSGGGDGVFKCCSLQELKNAPISTARPFLVEKYIYGDSISIEPLFIQSQLIAYSYSMMTDTLSAYGPSVERVFMPCPEVEPILQKLGETLQLNGFANVSFIREAESEKHFLFEMDFRPNRWVRHSELVGVEWSKALQGAPLQRPQSIKKIRHFQTDISRAIKTKKFHRLLYWMFNRNNSWQSIPLYDLKYFLGGLYYAAKKIIGK